MKGNNIDHIAIMGIVNLTDNSYFADSRCLDRTGHLNKELLIHKIRCHVEEGADIIDLGACSTRPGSQAVGEKEEWIRLAPALKEVRRHFPDIHLSIDTYWASVVRRAYDLIGDFIVNDISAGEDDPAMLRTVGELGLEYVAMHKRGNPQTMQSLTDYGPDPGNGLSAVTDTVLRYFQEWEQKARTYGIGRWILDPGFGFAKTIDQNYQLMKELSQFKAVNPNILVGISRKSMIFRQFGITPEEALPATSALHLAALQNGATILRVHDVKEARQVAELYRKLFHN